VTSQTRITPAASANASGRPDARDVVFARRVNHERDLVGRTA
jgi:hypothetical protein